MQQIALKHPILRMNLGLPNEEIIPERDPSSGKMLNSEITSLGSDMIQNGTSEQDLSPGELLAVSTKNVVEATLFCFKKFLNFDLA